MNVDNRQQIVITDLDIPFNRLVVFILKWVLASIPAMIILWIFVAILAALFSGIFGGLLPR
jgi:hypothetical protein